MGLPKIAVACAIVLLLVCASMAQTPAASPVPELLDFPGDPNSTYPAMASPNGPVETIPCPKPVPDALVNPAPQAMGVQPPAGTWPGAPYGMSASEVPAGTAGYGAGVNGSAAGTKDAGTAGASATGTNGGSNALGIALNYTPPPNYRITVDAMLMRLEHPLIQPVILDATTGAVLATTAKLDLGEAPGARLNAAYFTEEGTTFEFQYFDIFDWSSRFAAVSPPLMDIPSPAAFVRNDGTAMVDYNNSNGMQMSYRAEMSNVEVNMAFRLDKNADPLHYKDVPSTEMLFGIRYIELDEHFNLTSGVDPFLPSQYDIRTRNQLYGLQFGGRYRGCLGSTVMQLETKFGVYDNRAAQFSVMTDAASTILVRNFLIELPVTAYTAEANVMFYRQLNKTWSLRYGYNVLWIDGVARASDQLDFTASAASGSFLQFRSGAFIHGGSVGLEAKW